MYGREGRGREEEKGKKERKDSLKIAEKRTKSSAKGGRGEREHTEENKRKDRTIKRRKQ